LTISSVLNGNGSLPNAQSIPSTAIGTVFVASSELLITIGNLPNTFGATAACDNLFDPLSKRTARVMTP